MVASVSEIEPVWGVRGYMTIIHLIESYIYQGLFIFIFLEELGIPMPIPGDAILTLIGIQSTDHSVSWWGVVLVTVVSTLVGSSALYFLAQKLGRPWLLRHERILKYIHLSLKDVSMMEHYMQHYGGWFLVVARLMPGLRIIGTVGAGILDVPYRTFAFATTIGTLIWTLGYYWLGVFLGRKFATQISELFSNRLFLLLIFVVGVLLWVALFKFLGPVIRRHHGRLHQPETTSDSSQLS